MRQLDAQVIFFKLLVKLLSHKAALDKSLRYAPVFGTPHSSHNSYSA